MYLQNNAKLLNNVVWFFIFFTLGMLIVINQSVGFHLSVMPGSFGDGRFNNYILEHGYKYFVKDGFPYWNAPFFFPEKNVISYSDNLFGALPIYAACRFWTDRETAYQLWYLMLVAFNFFGAYYALRKLNVSIYASSAGAFIYAFAPIILIQTAHIQLLPRFFAPVAIVSFYMWLQEGKNKYFYISVFLVVYQFYCAIYLGYFLVYVLMAILGVYLVRERKLKNVLHLFDSKRNVLLTSAVLFVVLCLLAVLFYPYYLRSIDGDGYPTMGILDHHTPRLWTHILTTKRSIAWGWLNEVVTNTFVLDEGSKGEGSIFIGMLPYVFFIASLILYRKDKSMSFFLVVAAVLFVVILSVFDFSIYLRIVKFIPGAQAIRIISRYVIIAVFIWSIIAAFFLDRFLLKSNPVTVAVIFFLPVLMVFDNINYVALNQARKIDSQKRCMQVVDMYNKHKHENPHAKAFTVYFNTDTITKPVTRAAIAAQYHIDAMMASQIIGLPCVNGYSAKVPPDYGSYLLNPDKKGLDTWLHSNRVRTTVKETYGANDILILEK